MADEAQTAPPPKVDLLSDPTYKEIMLHVNSIYGRAGINTPSSIPNPAQQLLAIINGLYVRQGVEVSIIAGSICWIGDNLHYLLNFPLKTPKDVLLRIRAWNYLAEAAAMTPHGPQILQAIVGALDDALKLNVNLALDRSGGYISSAGAKTSFDEKKPEDGKRGQFESARYEPPKGDKQ
jgi:hypothetical protein